jgi:hypothetical protein
MKNPASPALSVIPPAARSRPPRALGDHGMALWNSIQHEYSIQDSGGTELLATACAALDTAELLAEEIAKDGAVIRTPKGVSRNPAIRDQLAARALCIRTLEKLGINISVVPLRGPGRPPSRGW